MKQREVTDEQNTKWTCVQAYTATEGKLARKISELAQNNEGKVPVVCTPSGGAKSVRLNLKEDWIEQLTDEELMSAINQTS